jgi:hypothetical protein
MASYDAVATLIHRESRNDAVATERMVFQILFSNIHFWICNFVDLLHYALNRIRGFVSLQLLYTCVCSLLPAAVPVMLWKVKPLS